MKFTTPKTRIRIRRLSKVFKMKKIKIFTVVGTRPEIIKLSEVIKALDRETDHILVHTGQNYDYELNEIFFKDLGLRKPDYFLNAAGAGFVETAANAILKIDPVLAKEEPDAFLILGDTNSCLAAYAAKRRKIPIFHMEAGNRCFDERVPEEINRRVVDHISDVNLVYSEHARRHLLREGLPPELVIKTGSPMYEVISVHRERAESSKILEELGLKPMEYFVLSSHREENIDNEKNFNRFLETIKRLSERYRMRIVFSVHPRTRKRIDEKGVIFPDNVLALKPLGFLDYIKLQKNAFCVLSDSGTINEEASILNFPAVNIRETHERHEAIDEAATVMSGLDPERVLQAVEVVIKQGRLNDRTIRLVSDYGSPNVSEKVMRIILSYTDYVNSKIWRKV